MASKLMAPRVIFPSDSTCSESNPEEQLKGFRCFRGVGETSNRPQIAPGVISSLQDLVYNDDPASTAGSKFEELGAHPCPQCASGGLGSKMVRMFHSLPFACWLWKQSLLLTAFLLVTWRHQSDRDVSEVALWKLRLQVLVRPLKRPGAGSRNRMFVAEKKNRS